MKNFRLKWVLMMFLALGLFIFIGCGNPKETDKEVVISSYSFEDNVYTIRVSNSDDIYPLEESIKVPEGATWIVSKEVNGSNSIESKEIELEVGDNNYYVIVTFSDNSTQTYNLNVYRKDLYTVTYVTNCKTKIPSVEVEEFDILEKPETELVKEGYKLIGWNYNFSIPVTKDLKIEAKWLADSYEVTYDANGGELEVVSTIVTFGENYNLEVPTLDGYDFMGWSYEGSLITDEKWNIAKDITVVATWERTETTYEIEYVIVGAVGPNLKRTYSNKESFTLRTPYKCGYKFVGWYYEGDFSGDRVYEIKYGTEGNLRLYSKWEQFVLENSEISFLGDSVTTFYSSTSDVNSYYQSTNQYYYPTYSATVKNVNQTWWYKIIEDTKTKLVVNESLSGSSCYNGGSASSTTAGMSSARISNLGTPDIVVIYLGINDNVNGYSVENFKNAYNTMLERIKEQCKDSYIFCATLGYSNYHLNQPNNHYSYSEERRIAFNAAIRECASDNDATVIEFANIQTIQNWQSLLGDNLHPNEEGMKAMASEAIKTIRQYVGNI